MANLACRYRFNPQAGGYLRDGDVARFAMNPWADPPLADAPPRSDAHWHFHLALSLWHTLAALFLSGDGGHRLVRVLSPNVLDGQRMPPWGPLVHLLGERDRPLRFERAAWEMTRLGARRRLTAAAVARVICAMAEDLIPLLPDHLSKAPAISIGPWERWEIPTDSPHADYLAPVERLRSLLDRRRDDFVGCWVHGSLATMDFVPGYSDFDALLIVRDEVLSSVERVMALRRVLIEGLRSLRRIDPLQHHGYFIAFEFMLRRFPAYWFPPVLFPYAKTLLGGVQRLVLRSAPLGEFGRAQMFWSYPQLILRFCIEERVPRDFYRFKGWMQQLLLLPVLYLQLKGVQDYKPSALALAREEFTDEQWRAIDLATELRDDPSARRLHGPVARWINHAWASPTALVDFDRVLYRSIPRRWRERFFSECLPAAGRLIEAIWDKGRPLWEAIHRPWSGHD